MHEEKYVSNNSFDIDFGVHFKQFILARLIKRRSTDRAQWI